MTRLALFFSMALLVTSLPGGLAGPACSRQHFKTVGCIAKCKSKWGWSGRMMGSNPWGAVMQKADSEASGDAALLKACGMETMNPWPTQPVVNIQTGSVTLPSTSTSATPTTSAEPKSDPTTAGFAPVVISISTEPSASSTEPATTTSPPPSPPQKLEIDPIIIISTPVIQPTAAPAPAPAPQAPTPQPPVGGGSNNGATSDGDIQAYLSSHNTVRANHGARALTWSDNLAAKAQQWANGCQFKHSGGSLGSFGENLAAGTGSSYGIQSAIKSWTDEVTQYNPANPQPSHFTQVVWKATTQVGCAVQLCDGIFDPSFGKAKFFVCEYSPAGNVIGSFAENVQV